MIVWARIAYGYRRSLQGFRHRYEVLITFHCNILLRKFTYVAGRCLIRKLPGPFCSTHPSRAWSGCLLCCPTTALQKTVVRTWPASSTPFLLYDKPPLMNKIYFRHIIIIVIAVRLEDKAASFEHYSLCTNGCSSVDTRCIYYD